MEELEATQDDEQESSYVMKKSSSLLPVVIREQRSKGLSFQVWPAASALCSYLEDKYPYPPGMKNVNVLELGSGTGLSGLVAARLGARVLLSDLPQAIPNIAFNIQANFAGDDDSCPQVQALSWGIQTDVEQLMLREFDFIIASDVVYYDHLFQPLLQTLKWLVVDNNKKANKEVRPTILLSHVRRWTKDSKFFKQARKLFQVDVVQTYPPLPGSKKPVVIYSLTAGTKPRAKRDEVIIPC